MIRIKDLPSDQRPREKAMRFGISALDERELLALLIRTGTQERSALEVADELIKSYGSLSGIAAIDLRLLTRIGGIGKATAIALGAAFEISRRIESERPFHVKTSPKEIYRRYRRTFGKALTERALLLLFRSRGRCLAEIPISKGGNVSASVSERECLSEIAKHQATRFLLVHNHPSGHALPSRDDIAATNSLRKKAPLVGAFLLDHIIIAEGEYFSFRENGLLD